MGVKVVFMSRPSGSPIIHPHVSLFRTESEEGGDTKMLVQKEGSSSRKIRTSEKAPMKTHRYSREVQTLFVVR